MDKETINAKLKELCNKMSALTGEIMELENCWGVFLRLEVKTTREYGSHCQLNIKTSPSNIPNNPDAKNPALQPVNIDALLREINKRRKN